MKSPQVNKQFLFNSLLLKHIAFWFGILGYFIITTDLKYYQNYEQLVLDKAILVLMQVLVAYSCLYFLIPTFLTPKKHLQFSIGLLFLTWSVYVLFVYIQEFHFRPKLLNNNNSELTPLKQFYHYVFSFSVFAGKFVKFLTPTVLIVLAKYYKNQQQFLLLKEQKKSTELATLKHQLNPHFLFNTLNNLYALSVIKSDEAPEVIEKLSEMLDHMLYGCNDSFVSLHKEIDLIENYIVLEKIRYNDRVNIEFTKKEEATTKVAPLILLTFVENAFKHGVSQELDKATIHIKIHVDHKHVLFSISNSIATNKVASKKKGIGLSNVKKQLELLYPDAHSLQVITEKNWFHLNLKLNVK